jgi:hypothetical protein
VRARSLGAGAFDVHVVLTARPLSKGEVDAAKDRDVIGRRTVPIDVAP